MVIGGIDLISVGITLLALMLIGFLYVALKRHGSAKFKIIKVEKNRYVIERLYTSKGPVGSVYKPYRLNGKEFFSDKNKAKRAVKKFTKQYKKDILNQKKRLLSM